MSSFVMTGATVPFFAVFAFALGAVGFIAVDRLAAGFAAFAVGAATGVGVGGSTGAAAFGLVVRFGLAGAAVASGVGGGGAAGVGSAITVLGLSFLAAFAGAFFVFGVVLVVLPIVFRFDF